jgi:hypothetical protein
MTYSTVEDAVASFPRPVLPAVQVDPDYQPIHATRKFLQANSRAIYTHLGGGTLGHLGLIVSDASYTPDCPNNERRTNNLGNTTSPRAGTSRDGWNNSLNQRRSPPLGRVCPDLPDMHLRPAGIEEADHQRI